jgi:UDP-GlcNAc:undecaprenyl-phosphate GlcNAc-1-phosphate transferase
MFKLKLGHRNTVLVLYVVTLLFALAAIITYFNPKAGLAVILVLFLGADLFIEFTGMINPHFHPILSMVNRLTGWPHMEAGEDPVDSLLIEEARNEEETPDKEPEKTEEPQAKPKTEDKAAE